LSFEPNPDHIRIKARSTNSLLFGAAVFNRIADFSELKKRSTLSVSPVAHRARSLICVRKTAEEND